MTSKLWVSLVAIVALVLFSIASVSAFGTITDVEINGVPVVSEGAVISDIELSNFAGERVPVLIVFKADDSIGGSTEGEVEDVRVEAWVSGERDEVVKSERFDVIAGKSYTRVISLEMPIDLDDELDETRKLEVVVESRTDTADTKIIDLSVQRESYLLEILDVDMSSEVKTGDVLTLDVVTKNRGRHESDDTFVRARIPALGLEDKAYFGDLSARDQEDPDKFDSAERRLFLRIPAGTPAGVYDVEVEAFNEDSIVSVTRRVVVVGAGQDSIVVSPVMSKVIAPGEVGEYSVTIVNAGSRVQVYELVLETSSGLTVNVDEPIVAIPAGTSRTVVVGASADKADSYNFAVNVHSDGQLVKRESFTAKVEGSAFGTAGNTTVLLTVILAIIFIVLLVVLIVLLTRKPEKSEEFGESYY